jgi:hypothetical protein
MKDELEHNFTLFPTLPRELRNQIWAHAASTLRAIHFFHANYVVSQRKGTKNPAILATCRES